MSDRHHPAAPARRQAMLGLAASLGGLTLASLPAWAKAAEEISRGAPSIHQETVLKASRRRVYAALYDARQFHKVSQLGAAARSGMKLAGTKTRLGREAGGAFSIFGGHIVGRQVELVPNVRIVQAWRVVTWDPGVYSIARFELREEASGTRILFDHMGFPPEQAEHLAEGWRTNYWEPLAKYLA